MACVMSACQGIRCGVWSHLTNSLAEIDYYYRWCFLPCFLTRGWDLQEPPYGYRGALCTAKPSRAPWCRRGSLMLLQDVVTSQNDGIGVKGLLQEMHDTGAVLILEYFHRPCFYSGYTVFCVINAPVRSQEYMWFHGWVAEVLSFPMVVSDWKSANY